MDTNNNQKNQSTAGAGIASAAYETVSKYGSAVKEHLSAYSGFDNETKTELAKGLKAISDYKVNDSYKASNIKQQAGFSAEVKTAARENAEKIIKGEKSKVVRTDDIAKQSDYKGNTIGGKNDQFRNIYFSIMYISILFIYKYTIINYLINYKWSLICSKGKKTRLFLSPGAPNNSISYSLFNCKRLLLII